MLHIGFNRRPARSTRITTWLLTVALCLFSLCAAAGAPSPERPPNIVFILIDDLGWTDFGCFSSRYYETPRIDRLSREGMRFTAAYANGPNCTPTRASLMSGQYTPRHGITQVGGMLRAPNGPRKLKEIPSQTVLRPEHVTLAETLKSAGYATASIGKWHLGHRETGPEGQGFDVNVAGNRAGHPRTYFSPYQGNLPNLPAGPDGEYLTDRLTDEAIRFMEAQRNRPFFLYLAHFAVHSPIQAKPELIERFKQKPAVGGHHRPDYAAMIYSVDENVGRVLDTLERLNLARNTLVILTSDNGGWSGATSNAPLRGYKGMLYEGGIRVPLIMRWLGRVPAGTVCETPVITLDFYPTLAEIAGAKVSSAQVLDGESLVPLLQESGKLKRQAIYWHFPHYLEPGPNVPGPWRTTPVSVIRQGDYKLLEFLEDGKLELYNLREDIGEERNLADRMPEKARELRTSLQAWRERMGAPPLEPQSESGPPSGEAAPKRRNRNRTR